MGITSPAFIFTGGMIFGGLSMLWWLPALISHYSGLKKALLISIILLFVWASIVGLLIALLI